jgi:hypothetical protein
MMKKDTLIDLYWILDAVQKGSPPNAKHVGACFISIRDELMLPDSEELVDHIRTALLQQQAAADALTDQALGHSRRRPLPDSELVEMMRSLCALHGVAQEPTPDLALRFGRLVETAHGIRYP